MWVSTVHVTCPGCTVSLVINVSGLVYFATRVTCLYVNAGYELAKWSRCVTWLCHCVLTYLLSYYDCATVIVLYNDSFITSGRQFGLLNDENGMATSVSGFVCVVNEYCQWLYVPHLWPSEPHFRHLAIGVGHFLAVSRQKNVTQIPVFYAALHNAPHIP